MSITALLATLGIDPRRVAVEHNLVVIKRTAYESTIINEGDEVEIVNFVGGGAHLRASRFGAQAEKDLKCILIHSSSPIDPSTRASSSAPGSTPRTPSWPTPIARPAPRW
jgi:thiamine biosynthesis protein ThiS